MKHPALLIIALLGASCTPRTTTSTSQPSNNPAAVQANKAPAECDPNYSPCVPVASDVDCVGGGGNGPAYVKGPVTVIGQDIYGLDRDGNGVGCE